MIKLENDFHEQLPSVYELADRVYASEEYKERLARFKRQNPDYDWLSWEKTLNCFRGGK